MRKHKDQDSMCQEVGGHCEAVYRLVQVEAKLEKCKDVMLISQGALANAMAIMMILRDRFNDCGQDPKDIEAFIALGGDSLEHINNTLKQIEEG